ncbi:hypothetical protein FHW68_004225 [Pseudomonas sp. Tn43]|uniref:hypothetical protein n=1 Tax=Pseudomonas sp. Tn43 TaxID=701213 RepID=UPI0016120B98|nr:hypothetical protein [Pseudomonas sp. Tn43]MBB3242675.1 hypothetical protein [Pseudomonas sp. Tn43]
MKTTALGNTALKARSKCSLTEVNSLSRLLSPCLAFTRYVFKWAVRWIFLSGVRPVNSRALALCCCGAEYRISGRVVRLLFIDRQKLFQ